MKISPNIARDYNKLIEVYEKKEKTNITEIINDLLSNYMSGESFEDKRKLLFYALLSLNIELYQQLLKNGTQKEILFLHKVLIYDFYDLCQAYKSFCGVQIFSVIRSVCDHTRIFLNCLYSEEFCNEYFSEYDAKEKKERYYKKRERNLTKALKNISNEARSLNTDSVFVVESAAFNLVGELYEDISDLLGEIVHLTEITQVKKCIANSLELQFFDVKTGYFDTLFDKTIEYLIITMQAISLYFFVNIEESTSAMQKLYNFLSYISEQMFKLRNVDKILIELKKQLKELYDS